MYAYTMSPDPLARETESQTQITESQTQILKSPRLRDHAPMQYRPKTVYDNTPKIHKHACYNTNFSNSDYNIQNSKP